MTQGRQHLFALIDRPRMAGRDGDDRLAGRKYAIRQLYPAA
jgi:hypothetical protein